MPFVARGSGASLSGGSLPVKEGIVIALNRLNHILRLDPHERIAVVEPGVINLDVSKAAAPFGLYYAPDPSSQQVCAIGGNVAFNSGKTTGQPHLHLAYPDRSCRSAECQETLILHFHSAALWGPRA